MKALLDEVTAVATRLSPEKVNALASKIRELHVEKAAMTLSEFVTTPSASKALHRLIKAWKTTSVSADEVASMLLAASHVFAKLSSEQSTELVWTGPTTPFVSPRHTEQALLQVIDAAQRTLFITSFVAYEIPTIVKALTYANKRNVEVSILLESSHAHGGSIKFDVIGKMKKLLPYARVYSWNGKLDPFTDGCVHAKVAVADGAMCFITSANLTGHAMDKNMEAGVLFTGGAIPLALGDHLHALVGMKIVTPV